MVKYCQEGAGGSRLLGTNIASGPMCPGFVGAGWAHWAELSFRWAWARSSPEVRSPGNPAGVVNILSCLPDFDDDDPSSHCHHSNQNLSTEYLEMDLPLAAMS